MSLISRSWLIICVLIVALICLRIDESSTKKYYRSRVVKYEEGGEPEKFQLSVSICYPLHPKNNFCKEKIQKFDGSFSKQLSCYGKTSEHKNEEEKKEIIKFFENGKLDKLMTVRQAITNETAEQDDCEAEDFHEHVHDCDPKKTELKRELKYEINHEDEICTTYTYTIEFRDTLFLFAVEYDHHQLFRLFVKVKHINDSHSHGHQQMVYARHCHLYQDLDIDFKSCYHNEAREYELSISRLNLKTEDENYRWQCCTDRCKGDADRKEHVKTATNWPGIDCGECAIYCVDSWQYAFDTDSYKAEGLTNINHSDLSLKFRTQYKELETKTKPDDYGEFLLKTFYFCLLLNVNIYSLLKLTLSRMISAPLRVPIDPFKTLRQIIKLILVVGFLIKLILFLTMNKTNVQYLLEPLFEDDNISVTICFKPTEISKTTKTSKKAEQSKECLEAIEKCTLGEIDDLTWDEYDFVDKVSIKTSLKKIIVQASEIRILYKDLRKCFNYNYNQPTLIQFASLMRSNVLEIEIQGAEFDFFHVQTPNKLPNSRSSRQKRFLLYKKKKRVVKDGNCVADFLAETDRHCANYRDCIDACMLNEYMKQNKRLPRFPRIEKSRFQGNKTLSKMRFDETNNKKDFNVFRSVCAEKYPQKDCMSTTVISLHRYNFISPNLIQINLNPEYEYLEETSESSIHTFLFYLFPYVHLITSFSLSGHFKPKLKLLKNWAKASIYFVYLAVFIVLIRLTMNGILDERLESSHYMRYVEYLELPKITICWNISAENFEDRSASELEDEGIPAKEIIKNITNLNSTTYEYRSLDAQNITARIGGNRSEINVCYWFNKRCVETNLNETYRRTQFKHNRQQMVFEIEVDSGKIPNGWVSVFLNSDNYLTNEFEFIARRDYHYHLKYSIMHSIREDNFLYFRSPSLLLNRWFYQSGDPQEQDDYYIQITSLFNEQQAAATSHIPIREQEVFNLKIKDARFLNYAYLRTLSSSIDDYSFNANYDRKLINFDHRFRYQPKSTTIITLVPDFICSFNYKNNRSSVLSLTLVLLSITATCFNVSLVAFPSLVCFWSRSLWTLAKQLLVLTVLLSRRFLDAKRRLFDAMECRGGG